MTRKPKALYAAVALALLGTLLIVSYARSSKADAADDRVSVLVATAAIPAGTPATDLGDKVVVRQVAPGTRATGTASSLTELRGKVAETAVASGDQVRLADFVAAADLPRAEAPDGTIEVGLSLEPARALAGDVRPGQTVAVIASFDASGETQAETHLILGDIVVTRVRTSEARPSDDDDGTQLAPGGPLLVTLAVSPADAERVVFAAEQGSLWLAGDTPEVGTAGTPVQQRSTVLR